MDANKYPPIDPSTICPTATRKPFGTYPRLDEHIPSRNVTLEEAKARNWPLFRDGRSCRFGHTAARYTSNEDACTDCARVKAGKPIIYPKARHQEFYDEPRRKPDATAAQVVVVQAPAALEPDAADQKFLAAYATERDIEKAATAVGTSAPLIETRRTCNAVFAAAMTDLETRLQIKRVLPPASKFSWSAEKVEQFLTTWIDTGDIATARDSIGLSASAYFKKWESDAEFAAAVEHAAPFAAKALEDRAHQLALAGNDKLLAKLLAAKMPNEYSERLKIDVTNDNRNLSDEQLNAKFAAALKNPEALKFIASMVNKSEPAVDVKFTEVAKLPASDDPVLNEDDSNDDLM